jgi:hypothetical protein
VTTPSAMRFAVSDVGITLSETSPEPLDVLFDGARVWSFHPVRDARPAGEGWLVPWPAALLPFLDGVTQVQLGPHGAPTFLHEAEVRFGNSLRRIRVVDGDGEPVSVDKGGHLHRDFAVVDQAARSLIVEAVGRVLTDLRDVAGLEAFLSFGCLLGAVRNGKMIGHDSDADVAFLSRHSHPYDIRREFQETARTMRGLGYPVLEMSGAHFKVWAELPDDHRCGIDVFGAYYFDGVFHMLPGVRGDLPRSALLPTSTIELEGRQLVAPARPEELLALTYGPGWRFPDPSFKYVYPRDLTRHVAGYWRGTRDGLRHWDTEFQAVRATGSTPSDFAQWVTQHIPDDARIVEVGHGLGNDAVWLATRGHEVLGLDYSGQAARAAAADGAAAGTTAQANLTLDHLNLLALAEVWRVGSRLAFEPVTRHLLARFLVDELGDGARQNFWRFASMIGRRSRSRTFLEFHTHRAGGKRRRVHEKRPPYPSPQRITREIEAHSGHVIERIESEDQHVCRMIVRWHQ